MTDYDTSPDASPETSPHASPDFTAGSLEDGELWARFQDAADREALGELFVRHADAAFRVARRLLGGDAASAEDAVQAAFIDILRGATWKGSGSMRSWIISIAANKARMRAREDQARRRREEAAASEPRPPVPAAGDGSAPREAETETREAMRAVEGLTETYRLPVLLHIADGLAISEVARVLDRREKTVRSQIARGLDLARELLRRRGVTVASIAVLLSAAAKDHASEAFITTIRQTARDPALAIAAAPAASFATLAKPALLAVVIVAVAAGVFLCASLIDRSGGLARSEPATASDLHHGRVVGEPRSPTNSGEDERIRAALVSDQYWDQPFSTNTVPGYGAFLARNLGLRVMLHRTLLADLRTLAEIAPEPIQLRAGDDLSTLDAVVHAAGFAWEIRGGRLWIGPAGALLDTDSDARIARGGDWLASDDPFVAVCEDLAGRLSSPVPAQNMPRGESLTAWVEALDLEYARVRVPPILVSADIAAIRAPTVTDFVCAEDGAAGGADPMNQAVVALPGSPIAPRAPRPGTLLGLLRAVAQRSGSELRIARERIVFVPREEPVRPLLHAAQ